MRIAIVNHTFEPTNGQANVNIQCALRLAARGHEVWLVGDRLPDEVRSLPRVRHVGVRYPQWVPSHLLRVHAFAAQCGGKLARLAREVDLVHVNGAMLYRGGESLACPSVNACHFVNASYLRSGFVPRSGPFRPRAVYQQVFTRLNSIWERRTYRRAAHTVAVSESVAGNLVDDVGADPATISVIYNGVDTSHFRPRAADEPNVLREAVGAKPGEFLLLFAGDLRTSRKNFDLLLDAVPLLDPRVRVAAAGHHRGSPYAKLIRRRRLGGRVCLLGHRRDLRDLLRGGDAFAFPSHYDPCPLVLLEAMACGLPVVTTRSVGNHRLITHGRDGFLLSDSRDLDGFVGIVNRLAADAELRGDVARQARATAERHDWDRVADEYEALYARLLARPSPAAPQGDIAQPSSTVSAAPLVMVGADASLTSRQGH